MDFEGEIEGVKAMIDVIVAINTEGLGLGVSMKVTSLVRWPVVSTEERELLMDDVKRFYKDELEPSLIEEYEGMVIAIDARSRAYEIATDENPFIHDQLLRRCPDAVPYTARIGRDHLYVVGGVS